MLWGSGERTPDSLSKGEGWAIRFEWSLVNLRCLVLYRRWYIVTNEECVVVA